MNLTDRIYLAVHITLTILVCARWQHVTHWPWYVTWNALAIAAILLFAHRRHKGILWEFAHDWLPLVLFSSAFEEVSYLSLALRGAWQNQELIALEAALFAVPPNQWLRQYAAPWLTELLEFGYFSFFLLYPVVGGALWGWRRRPRFAGAFRRMIDALSIGYLICYATYLVFPIRSPSHNMGLAATTQAHGSGGPFHLLVTLIQSHAGVHGNAFPSSHIMVAFVVLVFVFRYFPRFALPLLVCNLLMCVGAVYDGYHYAIDVLAGAPLGISVGALLLPRRTAPLTTK